MIKTVLNTFTTKPTGLMNYLVNHIELEKQRNRALIKLQTRSKWVDEAYQTVSKKCFVVRDIIKRFNSIKQGEQQSVAKRSDKNAVTTIYWIFI